jgi:hypothetical protein
MAFGTVLAAWAGEERAVASKVAMIALRSIGLPLWAVASGPDCGGAAVRCPVRLRRATSIRGQGTVWADEP